MNRNKENGESGFSSHSSFKTENQKLPTDQYLRKRFYKPYLIIFILVLLAIILCDAVSIFFSGRSGFYDVL